MTVYGDLDVSVLDEMPPGRTPIVTRGPTAAARGRGVGRRPRARSPTGRQAYVVCPLIEESEKLEVASAEETYDRLRPASWRDCASGCCTGACRRPRRR